MQEAERRILYTVLMYTGATPSEDAIEVLYPTSFSVLPFADWLKNFTSVAGMSTVSDDFKLALLKSMVLTMPGSLTQKEKMAFSESLQLVAPPAPEPGAGGASGGGSAAS